MNVNDPRDYELILNHIPGALVVGTDGITKYMNKQCAQYMGVDLESALGSHILNVFPETKMMENMYIDEPQIVFYHSFGIGISVHVPVFCNGERVGLLEYDVVQASSALYELADDYASYLDKELQTLKDEVTQLRNSKYSIDNIVGESIEIRTLKSDIRRAAETDLPVLIYGETGTGKELVAHSIHALSKRGNKNFIKINAANLPESIAESELFGYEPGTFTGARKEGKLGKFQLADKGTLFIDEINQMPSLIQPKLLRALQENEIEKLGGEESIPVDTRIIVTSNQDMREMVKSGAFREDLFYRLHVIPIIVPPLRKRSSDIRNLALHFINDYGRISGRPIREIDERIFDRLKEYSWPGNVRELQNVIERGIAFSQNGCLRLADIDGLISSSVSLDEFETNPIENAKKKAERDIIVQAIERCNGSKAKAAKLLGISRPLLYQKMKRLGLDK